jgi:hypothetical protein
MDGFADGCISCLYHFSLDFRGLELWRSSQDEVFATEFRVLEAIQVEMGIKSFQATNVSVLT